MMQREAIRLTIPSAWMLVITSCMLSLVCRESPLGPDDRPFNIAVDDISCTEASLHIRTQAHFGTIDITLLRDGRPVTHFRILGADTVVTDTGLQPSRTYLYQAQQLSGFCVPEQTTAVQTTTLDVTSDDFVFETTLLGDGNGSVLFDVAIVNATLSFSQLTPIILPGSTGEAFSVRIVLMR
jgi:hypothetical protein